MSDDTLRGTQTTIPDTLIPDVPMKYNPVDHDPFEPVYETTIKDPLLAKHLEKAPPLFRQLVGDNDKVKIRAVENDPFAQTLDNEAPTVDIMPRKFIDRLAYPGKVYKEGINSYDEEIPWAVEQASVSINQGRPTSTRMLTTDKDMLGWLFGPGKKGPTYIPTESMKNYPTDEDVENARKYDFAYGKPWENFFNNKSVTVSTKPPSNTILGIDTGPVTIDVSNLDKIKVNGKPLGKEQAEALKEQYSNIYAKAGLAIESSALATLGFDPRKLGLDPRSLGRTNIAGMYDRKTDQIWVNPNSVSTPVHESIHRGIQELAKTSFWKKEFDQFLYPETNELAVRYLMYHHMGNPEEGRGDIANAQIKQANEYFGDSSMFSKDRRKALEALENAAAQYLAKKHPGGPR